MAKKQTKPVEQPPREEEEQEESEAEQEELVKTPSSSPTGKQDSDSDSVSKSKKKKKKEAESSAAAAASPKTNKKKKKLSIEEGSSRDVNAKRLKTEEKKTVFERLWSEENEIVLLQAVMDFGIDPFQDKIRFEESVKSSISIGFTNDQLMQKIRSLKYEFQAKENKKVVTFLKPHDRRCFEMSKVIWGPEVEDEDEDEDDEDEEEEGTNDEDAWFDKSFLVGIVVSFGVDEESVKRGWRLVPMERKPRIQEKMRLLENEGVRLAVRRLNLAHEATSAIAEAKS